MWAMLALLQCLPQVQACTSVIVSGKATADGRPLMLKHRDTDDQQNSVRLFHGERYDFLGREKLELYGGSNDVVLRFRCDSYALPGHFNGVLLRAAPR